MTYTYTTLTVSAEAFDEIAGLLRNAGYDRTFLGNGCLDMNSLALERGEPSKDVQDNLANEIAGGEKQIGPPDARIGSNEPLSVGEEAVLAEFTRMLDEAKNLQGFPIIPDTYPCVLYFNTLMERDGFAEEVGEYDPNIKVLSIGK